MPETNEYRVGDRIRVRSANDIPERFRDKRGEVIRVASNGQLAIRFANPPRDLFGDRTHGGYWSPDMVRLVGRALVCGVGAKVIVSDPACSLRGRGLVSESFYGAEGVVIQEYGDGSSWRVDVDGLQAVIHRDYLTVIEEAPPPRFSRGDEVIIAHRAYSSAAPNAYNAIEERFVGTVGTVRRLGGDGAWEVALDDGYTVRVHENYLSAYVDDAPPLRSLGEAVHIDSQPAPYAEGRGTLPGVFSEVDGLITDLRGNRCLVRLLDDPRQQWIHQDHLTPIQVTLPAVGDSVLVLPSADVVANQMGVVVSVLDRSVQVAINEYHHLIHPVFLRVLTAEEAATMLTVGVRVRVSLDADDVGGNRLLSSMPGRVGVIVEGAPDAGVFYVQVTSGSTSYVSRDHLTPLKVSAAETRCSSCSEESPEYVAVRYGGRYCPACVAMCVHCEMYQPINGTAIHLTDERWECDACTVSCVGCRSRRVRDEMIENDVGVLWCEDCCEVCEDEDCENMAFGGHRHCEECRNDLGRDGLGRWRSTRPTMWLGGPVRRQGGYYIGFEHEITALGDYQLKPLRRWAEANLGSPLALDPKPDSTVRGFEIATQPMTPALFEEVDWDSYMEMLNREYPVSSEPNGHGIHVHIGRQAFRTEKAIRRDRHGEALKRPHKAMVTDAGMLAAFTYLLSRGHDQLCRIARRRSTWAEQVTMPVSAAIIHDSSEIRSKQRDKISYAGDVYIPRGAVNLTNPNTLEIRAFKSTRDADELKEAVRVVYLAAEYVRHLRSQGAISPKAVNWTEFSSWVREVMPEAYPSIAGVESPLVPVTAMSEDLMSAFTTGTAVVNREVGRLNMVMEEDDDPVPVGAMGEYEEDEEEDDEEPF